MPTASTNRSFPHAGWRPGKFFYLFLAQILLLVLFPYLEKPGLPVIVFRLLGAFAFTSAVYAVSDKPVLWITALCLMIPAALLNTLFVIRPERNIAVPALLSTISWSSRLFLCCERWFVRGESPTTRSTARSMCIC